MGIVLVSEKIKYETLKWPLVGCGKKIDLCNLCVINMSLMFIVPQWYQLCQVVEYYLFLLLIYFSSVARFLCCSEFMEKIIV